MRKEYGRVLRELFARRMHEELPEFSQAKLSTIYFTPGDRAFEKKLGDGTSLWINLNIDSKLECFTIEIGWSDFGRWPELGMRPSPIRPENKAEFSEKEYLTRLPFLWTEMDTWFEIEPFNPESSIKDLMKKMEPISKDEARDKVSPVVEDCIDRISEYAVPYLQQRAEQNP